MKRLSAIYLIMGGFASFDTDASTRNDEEIDEYNARVDDHMRIEHCDGFVEGSEMHDACTTLGLDMTQVERGDATSNVIDMFDAIDSARPTPMARYVIDYDAFWAMIPDIREGVDIDDVFDPNGDEYVERAIACDDESVMFQCSRGLCTLPIDKWRKGVRHCVGC